MNRKQRRSKGYSEEDYLNSPCTLKEVVQISRAAAEDVVGDAMNRTGHLYAALSIQVEMLKELVIREGMTTEKDFREDYIRRAEEFNKMQREMLEKREEEPLPTGDPSMTGNVGDIEITTVRGE